MKFISENRVPKVRQTNCAALDNVLRILFWSLPQNQELLDLESRMGKEMVILWGLFRVHCPFIEKHHLNMVS